MAYGVWQATIASAINGLPVPGASILVTLGDTEIEAVLFQDRDGLLPLGNPFNANDSGFARFYCDTGRYNIQASHDSEASEWRDVIINAAGVTALATQEIVPDGSGEIDLSLDGVSVWLVDLDKNITNIILPTNTDPDAAFVLTIVFSQPLAGGFSVSGWPELIEWEFGLTPVIDETSFGKTSVQFLLVNGREPLGVS